MVWRYRRVRSSARFASRMPFTLSIVQSSLPDATKPATSLKTGAQSRECGDLSVRSVRTRAKNPLPASLLNKLRRHSEGERHVFKRHRLVGVEELSVGTQPHRTNEEQEMPPEKQVALHLRGHWNCGERNSQTKPIQRPCEEGCGLGLFKDALCLLTKVFHEGLVVRPVEGSKKFLQLALAALQNGRSHQHLHLHSR